MCREIVTVCQPSGKGFCNWGSAIVTLKRLTILAVKRTTKENNIMKTLNLKAMNFLTELQNGNKRTQGKAFIVIAVIIVMVFTILKLTGCTLPSINAY